MEDLIYRQDAIEFISLNLDESATGDISRFYNLIIKKNIESLKRVPAANTVKVVLCKKCKWHGYLTCSNPNGLKGRVTGNDFCSYGEEGEFVRKRR